MITPFLLFFLKFKLCRVGFSREEENNAQKVKYKAQKHEVFVAILNDTQCWW